MTGMDQESLMHRLRDCEHFVLGTEAGRELDLWTNPRLICLNSIAQVTTLFDFQKSF